MGRESTSSEAFVEFELPVLRDVPAADCLEAYLNITNVSDRIPDFFSGTGAGGVNLSFFSGMDRQYKVGVQMRF